MAVVVVVVVVISPISVFPSLSFHQAGVPIMIAVNKIDKPGADPTRVMNELMRYDLLMEEFGGERTSGSIVVVG